MSDDETTHAATGASGRVDALSAGRRLMLVGALGLLAVGVLFDVLVDSYGVGHVPPAIAALIAASLLFGAATTGMEGMLLPAGLLLGLIGAWDLIDELRDGILGADAETLVGALLYYAAAITTGVGALRSRVPD